MELFVLFTSISLIRSKYSILCKLSEKPEFEVVESEITTKFKLKELLEDTLEKYPYYPSLYCLVDYHGQLQTAAQFNIRNFYLFCKYLVTVVNLLPNAFTLNRELLILPDGGTVGLDWAVPINQSQNNNNNSLILIHHGLCGSSQSEYIVFQIEKLLKVGFQVCVINARGCGGVHLTSTASFIRTSDEDVRNIILNLENRFDNIFLLGYSLGGATVLRYLGKYGSNCKVSGGVCVSPVWNYNIWTRVFFIWSILLTIPLKHYILTHHDMLRQDSNGVTLWQVLTARNLDEMDSLLYRGYGFESVEQYRRASSPVHSAKNISVPTVVVNAKDDPICSIHGAPSNEERGDGLILVKTMFGGHLGFPSNLFPFTTSWTDDFVAAWFDNLNTVLVS